MVIIVLNKNGWKFLLFSCLFFVNKQLILKGRVLHLDGIDLVLGYLCSSSELLGSLQLIKITLYLFQVYSVFNEVMVFGHQNISVTSFVFICAWYRALSVAIYQLILQLLQILLIH